MDIKNNIKIRQNEVQLKINTLQNELNELDVALRVIENLTRSKKNAAVIFISDEGASAQKNNTKTSIPKMIHKILNENVDGMSVVDLLSEIHKVYESNMKRQNLATTLSRLKKNGLLVKSGNKLWALNKETSGADTPDVSKSTDEVNASPKDSQGLEPLAEPLVSTENHQQEGGGNGP